MFNFRGNYHGFKSDHCETQYAKPVEKLRVYVNLIKGLFWAIFQSSFMIVEKQFVFHPSRTLMFGNKVTKETIQH